MEFYSKTRSKFKKQLFSKNLNNKNRLGAGKEYKLFSAMITSRTFEGFYLYFIVKMLWIKMKMKKKDLEALMMQKNEQNYKE